MGVSPTQASESTSTVASAWSSEPSDVAASLGVDISRGLDGDAARGEVSRRLHEHGRNVLRETKRVGVLHLLLRQFESLVILLLIAAAIVSLVFGRWLESAAIVAVIVVNTVIGFVTELKAVRSMEALRSLARTGATVRRGGKARDISASDLVPGDIVLLEAGDIVTADMRLVEASKLEVNESTLTGESEPVRKQVEQAPTDAPLAERASMVFKGTTVSRGSGEGIVVATGMATELGRIASLTEESEDSTTPLERRLERLGRRLILVTLVLAGGMIAIGLARGKETLLIVETGVALAVAAIPEGLPIVATLALARGMWRMARRNALLNRLSAVEALGSTSVILTDKTGTLTENQMTVSLFALPSGDVEVSRRDETSGYVFRRDGAKVDVSEDALLRSAVEIGVLCNNASIDAAIGSDGDEQSLGDPTEVALLWAGGKAGLDRASLLEASPEEREEAFDPDTMAMATFHGENGGYRVAVKGAAESVVDACVSIGGVKEPRTLESEERRQWLDRARAMARNGLRVLALAEKRTTELHDRPYEGLTLVGLVGMLDPPREEVGGAVRACQRAGIRVVMVTGDQAETAGSIASKLGLGENGAEVETGGDLPSEGDAGAREAVLGADVFARMEPEQKLRLIKIHQDAGAVVAMTGDGVNDAPALTSADIGVAMGRRGSEAAKQAADMVLRDDNFRTIVAAVEQGRVIFASIRKAVMFMLCTNVAEVIAVTFATLVGWTLPLRPLQILYLNVLTDVLPALALSVGPGSGREMEQPPRAREEPILTRTHWGWLICWATVVAVCVLGSMRAAIWMGIDDRGAVTVSFLTLGLSKLWFVLNLRAPGSGMLRNEILSNRWMWGAFVLCVVMLLIAVYVPVVSAVLETTAPSFRTWTMLLAMSLIPVGLGQLWIGLRHGG